ncbi:MAG: ADP-ribosylation factor-like protein [Candidatus Heimdallarchaeaceae archaeon]
MNDRSLQSKIVILGLSQSGKTSIRQVVFEGFAPQATSLNPATVRINRKLFNFAGSSINLVDVGGQSSYLNELFEKYTERTFSDLKALIYVVDVSDASNIMRSKYYFDLTLDNLKKIGSSARIYVFAHKMDVVPVDKRAAITRSIKDIFELSKYPNSEIYETSIFEENIWDAMQRIFSVVYPRDLTKASNIQEIVSEYNLNLLTLSTSKGLVLYSEPEKEVNLNLSRLRSELVKIYSPSLDLNYIVFSLSDSRIFIREIEEDLVITSVFSSQEQLNQQISTFHEICDQMRKMFKTEEVISVAKIKVKDKLITFFESHNILNREQLEHKINKQIYFKCDICGRELHKSILEVALENANNFEHAIQIKKGFGTKTIELYPIHECITEMREIPILLDNNCEYRSIGKSRPV